MNSTQLAIVVIDPLSSGKRYGSEIKKKGYYAIALNTRDKFPRGFHRLEGMNGFDEVICMTEISEAIHELSQHIIIAIVPGSDSALRWCDALAERFNVIGNPRHTSPARVNKIEMKKMLRGKGVDCVDSFSISLDQIMNGIKPPVSFPAIVKPVQGTGSKYVKICQSPSDTYHAVAAIEHATEEYLKEEKYALIEDYIQGQEYFIVTANHGESNIIDLLCFAKYEKIIKEGNPSIYKTISSLSTSSHGANEALKYASAINNAIEAHYGINDIELIINDGKHCIIEQNGRLPGANVPSLIEICTGVNCYDLNLDIYMGAKIRSRLVVDYKKHFCICCLVSDRSGIIDSIEGIESIRQLSSLHQISLLIKEGDTVSSTEDFLSTWGFIYLIHEDQITLQEHASYIHETVKLNTRIIQ